MTINSLRSPAALVVLGLEERNRIAKGIISSYASKHGHMDVGVGLVGLIPGAAPFALAVAVSLQAPVIYQPLAAKLAEVYLATPTELARSLTGPVADVTVETAAVDVANEFALEFGIEFIQQIAFELLAEVGLGTIVSLIPVVGALVAAGLDWKIATMMTKRVGRMTAIYFQNNASWLGSKKKTYEVAKETHSLDSIRKIPDVDRALVRNLRAIVEVIGAGKTNDQVRDDLRKQGVPEDLIEEVLRDR